MLRHLYVLRRSWPRLLELMYWPLVQMILWGFVTKFFLGHSDWVAQAAGVLISAVLLWDVLFRANLGVSLPFIEEMWSRNLAQLFISPLRDVELIVALVMMSLVRTLISVTPAAFLALPFFDVWVFQLGVPLLAFFANLLIFGSVIGIGVAALILRFGLGAESLCWLGIFLLAPVSAIYYPVSALPGWLQTIALMLPSAHTFEGMRGVLFDGVFSWSHFWWAAGLNGVMLAAASLFFLHMMKQARIKGLLMQQGE
ncbi:ABC transporter [Magnetovibrio blakemorei]|uniref:Transport permease protein n=2 Tax=Magnetovibrio blakemorei TaxID=28181 RepID=A0A1E5Q6K3_9PROT|nr:ABC transporter [Magnetovibrio blakemorei]